jgi:hypothetical protein
MIIVTEVKTLYFYSWRTEVANWERNQETQVKNGNQMKTCVMIEETR